MAENERRIGGLWTYCERCAQGRVHDVVALLDPAAVRRTPVVGFELRCTGCARLVSF